jgi:hypothetical protein
MLIMCKKVPPESDVKKIEKLHERVKLLAPPNPMPEPKPNAAVIRLAIPKDNRGEEIE